MQSAVNVSSTPDRPRPASGGYMPQIDGLRCLAVFGVWIAHWGLMQLPGFDVVNWGTMGVMLFFVLSGFLITGILSRDRMLVEAGTCSVGTVAKIFYIRRFLRIMPLYYVTLLLAAILLPNARSMLPFYATYTTNIRLAAHPVFPPPVGGHFWTLAAEEQFYFVWPWVVLLVPRAYKVASAATLVLVGIAVRIFLATHNHHGVAMGCIDQFGLGALLAMLSEGEAGKVARRYLLKCGKVAFPLLVLLIGALAVSPNHPVVAVVIMPLYATLFFTWLIGASATGFTGLTGKFLEWTPLVFLGRISYGLYVLHGFMIDAWERVGLAPIHNPWIQTTVFAVISVLLATISWYVMEKPINALKRHFQVPKAKPVTSQRTDEASGWFHAIAETPATQQPIGEAVRQKLVVGS